MIVYFNSQIEYLNRPENKRAASQHGDFEGNGSHLDLLTFYLLKGKHFCGFSLHTSIYVTVSTSLCFERSVLSKDFHYHLAISSVLYKKTF